MRMTKKKLVTSVRFHLTLTQSYEAIHGFTFRKTFMLTKRH